MENPTKLDQSLANELNCTVQSSVRSAQLCFEIQKDPQFYFNKKLQGDLLI